MEAQKLGYSAEVVLWLECQDLRIPLSQAGPTFIITRTPVSLPPCDGRVIMVIDGKEFETPVRLVNGMSSTSSETVIEVQEPVIAR